MFGGPGSTRMLEGGTSTDTKEESFITRRQLKQ